MTDEPFRQGFAMIADRAFRGSRCPTRSDLLWTAMAVWAPHDVVTALTRLPDTAFVTAEELWRTLERQEAYVSPEKPASDTRDTGLT